MKIFDHWHPVARSRDLRRRPLEVRLAGRSLVLFRTTSGQAAALDNACPHRRFKLSAGDVVGDRIRCKYHGWCFDAAGRGESPATPKLTPQTTSFETREAHGLVWIKSRDSAAAFPVIEAEGFYPLGAFVHDAPAPLELTVDNFNEIEHSGLVHRQFGYDLDRLHEVQVECRATDDAVHIVNRGPTKRIFWFYAFWMGIRRGDLFHDRWTTWFSPVHSVFDHWWTDPSGTVERMFRWRVYVFYVPWDHNHTRVFSIGFAKSRYPGPNGGMRLIAWLFRRELDREICHDVGVLRDMACYDPRVEGLKLGRFDKVLGLTRERIRRIYRGDNDTHGTNSSNGTPLPVANSQDNPNCLS